MLPLLALLLAGCPHRADPPSPCTPGTVDAAVALVEQGRDEEAEASLRAHVEACPDDWQSRLVLARFLAYAGRPEEAAGALEAGLGGSGQAELAFALAVHHFERALDGPTDGRRATDGDFRREQLDRAAESAEVATRADPDEVRLALFLVQIRLEQDERAEAARLLADAVARWPECSECWFGHGMAQVEVGRLEEGRAALERSVALAPQVADGYLALADVLATMGEAEAAASAAEMGQYCAFFHDFAFLPWTPERAERVAILRGLGSEGQADADRLLQGSTVSPTDEDARLAAAFAWHHTHDHTESLAWDVLAARSDPQLYLALLDNARSTCTIGAACWGLAHVDHPDALAILGRVLRQDLGLLEMDIAGALAYLGDPRAAPLLTDLMVSPPAPAGPPGSLEAQGVLRARQRAAMSLGAFDTPATRSTLQGCVGDLELGFACRAGLFRMTGDRAWIEPLIDAAAPGEVLWEVDYLEYSAGIRVSGNPGG